MTPDLKRAIYDAAGIHSANILGGSEFKFMGDSVLITVTVPISIERFSEAVTAHRSQASIHKQEES